ncbi:ABC-type metal ion transport system, periplasmic component [Clostridium aceticum]|uniref:ABC-type metal ion transport system, periplasmic component n=1 Tax=Clostridium aceticum TaxID=84022 RepID=A0A0G3W811_9CLOT|nr:zinc ABC transporter substrate-binding protein [Clostridium aceticum]AKL94032.1 ABC-type metal ion transport system, periplasmic component [Clostridium aceticum]
MKLKSFIVLIVIVGFLGGMFWYTLNLNTSSEVTASKEGEVLNVVATTTMITDLLQVIGGDVVEVRGLMGPGIDPHLYQATEGDVNRLQSADIIFYNGLHLEGKMQDIFREMSARSIQTVAITDAIATSKLLSGEDEYEDSYDPHIWFDVSLWQEAVVYVRDVLVEKDPVNKAIYTANAEKYLLDLEELHEYVIQQALRVPEEKRVLITAHDAFQYFGESYGFEVLGLQGISTESEAGIADVRELAEIIVAREIPAIFIESSVPERNVIALQEAVAARDFEVEIGGELYSDAMGDWGTPEGTYLGMVRYNINTIVEALLK